MALYNEIFQEHMQVKAVKVELRPFNKTPSNPRVASSTAYLRIHITGHVKHWTIQPVEDMREMSVNQINEAIDEENWMVTIYGQEVGAVPAPSTPSSRPRKIPPQPGLPPRQDDAEVLA